MVLPLATLCEEMHRYAAVIALPADMMPSCNSPDRGGLHLALSSDGQTYVLTYSEKDDPEVLVVSDNPDQVLERVFDELTISLAAERSATTTVSRDHPSSFQENPSNEQLRAMAIASQKTLGSAQEALLAKIKPRWAQRQAVRNAEQLKHIDVMFGR
jgi:hypothetical protein